MSDKPAPRKNPAKREESVLGSLSSTRPTRMSRRAADGSSRATTATPQATTKPRATTATPQATTKPKAATTKPRATTTQRPKAAPAPRPREPVAPEPPRRTGPPSGPELVTTAVQAIGELAEIGVTLGGQALRRAVRRIPRP